MTTQHRPKPYVPGEVYYPESDGEPMAETDTHWQATADLTHMLQRRYRDDADVYVASDNFVYYEEGNPSAVISPDVYVVFGVPGRLRRTYRLWDEGGHAPTVVFEVSSRGTWVEDKGNKMTVCAMLGVREYYLYDPELDYLEPPLQGYRLDGDQYDRMLPDAEGAHRSDVLGLTLHLDGARLVLTDTVSGERLLSPMEVYAEVLALRTAREAEAAAREAAEAGREAEAARKTAEAGWEAEAAARETAETARETVEAENQRLRAELERLRGDNAVPPTTTEDE
jgi:Uma2 family endonuclease